MPKIKYLISALMVLCMLLAWGCSSDKDEQQAAPEPAHSPFRAPLADTDLPENIDWLTNDTDPVFASPDAVTGGTLRLSLLSFPLTFRVVGPDSNSSFRSAILGNQLSLISIHPNTERIVPEIATHWAFGKDKKTMYFRLNPDARWSDGMPVTAHDFAYTLAFMRSPHIVAPWYNDYYTKEIEKVVVYDDHTLAVVASKPDPDLYLKVGISPTPSHFYGDLDENFVRDYNWKIAPNTGPYQVSGFEKGKFVEFSRKPDWWASDLRFFKNRFNVDKVVYTVVKDFNMSWEYFKQAEIDAFPLTMPDFWHDKTQTPVFDKGYVHRIWFFNDTQQSAMGMWLNQDIDIFKDVRVRYAFAHAMNIQKVIDTVLRGDYFRLEQGFVGYGDYTNPDVKARRFDLEKVNDYMTGAGWQRGTDGIWEKEGMRFSVDVTYSHDGHTPRLVVLKEEARKAGIELNLRRLDPSASYKQVLEKKHEVGWVAWSTSLRPQYWEHFHSENAHKPQTNNITNTDDPEMDRLIEAYRASLDAEERKVLSRQIQAKIHEIGAFVPTFMVPYVRQACWRWWRLPDPPGTRHTDDLFEPFSSGTGGLFWFDRKLYDETQAAMKAGTAFDPVTIEDRTFYRQ
ncbi:extracellular solute-binding protein [Desulfosudis oleivorans]|uniref:Extracellular solute-binding protein family 5 n=1 Tax=Desulfosudis oleivorans (strain DSM 6200 / JCM 39069 / Hxd3) TaxID=96561 RepID=A8ZWE4_DESOH|nr:extracellular solute-binding protein [Desulfosudis oleivorans]ABW66752.1 extracellular solute-binding protein family 5 [Desulfosudis oleivorans Hxd3]